MFNTQESTLSRLPFVDPLQDTALAYTKQVSNVCEWVVDLLTFRQGLIE
jgi:hypothetical protein